MRVLRLLKEVIHFLPGRGVRRWQDVHNLHPGAPTVVLVSGFTAPRRTLSVFRRRLKRDGFNVLVVGLDWQVNGFVGAAERLARRVEQLIREMSVDPSQIFLVGHSAGGLVARYYIQWLGGHRASRGLLTMATPHRGTWLALLGFFTHFMFQLRCLLQLVPLSPFLRRLNGFPYPPNFPLISLHSREDPICSMRSSRVPKKWAASPEVKVVELRGLSHSDFLLRKSAYRAVYGYLIEYLKPSTEVTVTKSETSRVS